MHEKVVEDVILESFQTSNLIQSFLVIINCLFLRLARLLCSLLMRQFLLGLILNLAKKVPHLCEISNLWFSLGGINLHSWFLYFLLFFFLLLRIQLLQLGMLVLKELLIDEFLLLLKTLPLSSAQVLPTFHHCFSTLDLSICEESRVLFTFRISFHKFHPASCFLSWLDEFGFHCWPTIQDHAVTLHTVSRSVEMTYWSVCF